MRSNYTSDRGCQFKIFFKEVSKSRNWVTKPDPVIVHKCHVTGWLEWIWSRYSTRKFSLYSLSGFLMTQRNKLGMSHCILCHTVLGNGWDECLRMNWRYPLLYKSSSAGLTKLSTHPALKLLKGVYGALHMLEAFSKFMQIITLLALTTAGNQAWRDIIFANFVGTHAQSIKH